MTTTTEEKELLKSLQTLRVVNYARYQELNRVFKNWIDFEAKSFQTTANEAQKIIAFPTASRK